MNNIIKYDHTASSIAGALDISNSTYSEISAENEKLDGIMTTTSGRIEKLTEMFGSTPEILVIIGFIVGCHQSGKKKALLDRLEKVMFKSEKVIDIMESRGDPSLPNPFTMLESLFGRGSQNAQESLQEYLENADCENCKAVEDCLILKRAKETGILPEDKLHFVEDDSVPSEPDNRPIEVRIKENVERIEKEKLS